MAAFSSMLLGALAGAVGVGLMAKKKKGDVVPAGPVPYDQLPGRRQDGTNPVKTAQQKVQATNPIDAVKAASQNTASAMQVAAKAKRKAAAGGVAARAQLGMSASQKGVSNMPAPRTLLGSY